MHADREHESREQERRAGRCATIAICVASSCERGARRDEDAEPQRADQEEVESAASSSGLPRNGTWKSEHARAAVTSTSIEADGEVGQQLAERRPRARETGVAASCSIVPRSHSRAMVSEVSMAAMIIMITATRPGTIMLRLVSSSLYQTATRAVTARRTACRAEPDALASRSATIACGVGQGDRGGVGVAAVDDAPAPAPGRPASRSRGEAGRDDERPAAPRRASRSGSASPALAEPRVHAEVAGGGEGVDELAAARRCWSWSHTAIGMSSHVPGDRVAEQDQQQRPAARRPGARLRGSRRSWMRLLARHREQAGAAIEHGCHRQPRTRAALAAHAGRRRRPPATGAIGSMPRDGEALRGEAAPGARSRAGRASSTIDVHGAPEQRRPRGRPARPRAPATARAAVVGRGSRAAAPCSSRAQGAGRVEGDQPAAVHQREPVAVLGLLHVVRA